MNLKADWKVEFTKEIEHAMQARSIGNEGMARVCSRRAAGIVIGEYLSRHGYVNLINSTYKRLELFTELPDVDQVYKDIARHFLLKVNQERRLPMDADLISEAVWLEQSLLQDHNN